MRSTVMLLMLAHGNGLVTTPLRMHQTYQPTTRPFLPASRHHAALMQSAELAVPAEEPEEPKKGLFSGIGAMLPPKNEMQKLVRGHALRITLRPVHTLRRLDREPEGGAHAVGLREHPQGHQRPAKRLPSSSRITKGWSMAFFSIR